MIDYTLFDTLTGAIRWHAKGSSPEEVLGRFDDCDGVLEGQIDGNRYEIIAGVPAEKPGYAEDRLTRDWAQFRAERDRRLQASDWTQMPDAPVDPAPWRAYRQALRDMPNTVTDPTAVTWPTPPEQEEPPA